MFDDVYAVFNQAVSAGTTALNSIMDMFYGDRWGYIKDPFGHLWSIAIHKKDLTPNELKKAAVSLCSQ
ncbi:MAG: VOC family protein [Nitrososphaeraceae archaeon]